MGEPSTPERLPSVPQMVNRANSAHHELLHAIANQRRVNGASALTAGQVRGFRTADTTLARWKCTERVDGADQLTDRGAALLAALDAKWGHR